MDLKSFENIRSKITNSLWFLPGLLVLAFSMLAFLFLHLDKNYPLTIGGTIFGFFGGSASAARGLLSTIAGSLITVISMAFSITMVALQQASTQYSPRILRNFTSDKGNQIVLGTYLATFIYSLLVLRVIRADMEDSSAYVPALSISFAIFLAVVCSGLLIYFIDHIVSSLQAEHLVESIHRDLVKQIDDLFPEVIGRAVDVEITGSELFESVRKTGGAEVLHAKKSGFLRLIDKSTLQHFHSHGVHAVNVLPRLGEFVNEGEVVFEVAKKDAGATIDAERLHDALIIGYPRSTEQDPLFAIRMLVDVALKALSPAVHDPTTAEYCIFHLSDALCRLAKREFPPIKRTFEGNPIVFIFNVPDWGTYIDQAFSQIREASESSQHVTKTLLDQLLKIARCVPRGNRSKPLVRMLDQVRESIEKESFEDHGYGQLKGRLKEIEKALKDSSDEDQTR